MKMMKQDSSTIAWNAMGDEWFQLAQTGESRNCFIMPNMLIWRHRTMEEYVKTLIKVGLTIVDLNEPRASDEQAKKSVPLAWLQKIPLYLYWELKK